MSGRHRSRRVRTRACSRGDGGGRRLRVGREYGKLTMAMFSSLRKLIRPSNTGLLEFYHKNLLFCPTFPLSYL